MVLHITGYFLKLQVGYQAKVIQIWFCSQIQLIVLVLCGHKNLILSKRPWPCNMNEKSKLFMSFFPPKACFVDFRYLSTYNTKWFHVFILALILSFKSRFLTLTLVYCTLLKHFLTSKQKSQNTSSLATATELLLQLQCTITI